MKKVLLSVLAVGMLTACSQDETVDMQAPSQIAFAGAFVDNVTRAAAEDAADPSTTTANIDVFNVWGFVNNSTGTVFDNVEVKKDESGKWSYDVPQYWTPNNTYRFFALTPNNEYVGALKGTDADPYANGLGEIKFVNANGTEDLLYATAEVKTPEALSEKPAPVKFVFDHLLSKVKFTFKNAFATGYSSIKVTNIKMAAPAEATVTLNQEQGNYVWDNHTAADVKAPILYFGNAIGESEVIEGAIEEGGVYESDLERLTIPAAATTEVAKTGYTVTFDVELFQDKVSALTATKTVVIKDYELKPGYAYNFIASLDPSNIGDNPLYEIEFEVEVEEWVENGLGILGHKDVATEAQLLAAVAEGAVINLTKNIALSKTLQVEKDVILNLNGKSLTIANESDELGEGDGIIVTAGNLTINGQGTVEANTRAIWARGNGGAKITINGGTYIGAKTTTEVIYASGNGVITINSGTFEAVVQDDKSFAAPQYAVLNLHSNGKDGFEIKVYGGSFKKFNPSDNVSENPKKDFVAPGYKSVANGDYFDVVAE